MNRLALLLVVFLLLTAATSYADDGSRTGGTGGSGSVGDIPRVPIGTLEFVEAITRDDWKGLTSIALSPDQKFAYAAAFNSASVYAFRRDSSSGHLELIQTVASSRDLNGVTSLRLSDDGRLAVSAAFRSNTITLFQRDPATGQLQAVDRVRGSSALRPRPFGAAADPSDAATAVAGASLPSSELSFAIEAVFAPGSRDIYALGSSSQTVVALRVVGGKRLQVTQVIRSQENCFANARGVVVSPDGRSIYVASQRGDSLTVLDRDPETGRATIKQICRDGQDDYRALDGAFSVGLSPEAETVYVSSGNFDGDDAVSVYRRAEEGTVQRIQELFHAGGETDDFRGGNEILVSPDGQNVYALGTASDTLVAFRRDPQKGTLELVQVLKDQTDGVNGLEGVSGLAISDDGGFFYTAGGNALAIFRRNPQPPPLQP